MRTGRTNKDGRLGRAIATSLRGAWRAEPSTDFGASADLRSIEDLAIALGAGPLLWWALRRSALANTATARAFHDAFRLSSLDAVRQSRALIDLVNLLRGQGIEPIVVKGWAIARHYQSLGLRPYGDHDLVVPARNVARARRALNDAVGLGALADLHSGFQHLDDRRTDELRDRSIVTDCEGTPVRVLAAEDHLRLLCRHLLYHGATRPIWLCDVAIAVESRPAGFDWTMCLGHSKRARNWITHSLQLAQAILGMSIVDTPAEDSRTTLPRWVVPAVFKSWSSVNFGLPKFAHSLGRGAIAELRRHWPNPLQATFAVGAPINNAPRWPIQLAACVPAAARVTTDLLQRYARPRVYDA